AVHETHAQPSRDELGVRTDHTFEKRARIVAGPHRVGIVPRERVRRELRHRVEVVTRRKVLERANPNVARSDAPDHRAPLNALAHDAFSGSHDGKRAIRRYPKRRHGFADDVFAERGPYGCAPVAATREWRTSRSFELHITPQAVAPDDLAEQDGAAITELRH